MNGCKGNPEKNSWSRHSLNEGLSRGSHAIILDKRSIHEEASFGFESKNEIRSLEPGGVCYKKKTLIEENQKLDQRVFFCWMFTHQAWRGKGRHPE